MLALRLTSPSTDPQGKRSKNVYRFGGMPVTPVTVEDCASAAAVSSVVQVPSTVAEEAVRQTCAYSKVPAFAFSGASNTDLGIGPILFAMSGSNAEGSPSLSAVNVN